MGEAMVRFIAPELSPTSKGTVVQIDGKDITKHVRAITVVGQVGDINRVYMQVMASIFTEVRVDKISMEVLNARCVNCHNWEAETGWCSYLNQKAPSDFGCIKWAVRCE